MTITTLVFADPGVAAALHLADDATPEPVSTTEPSGVPTMRPDLEVSDVSPGLGGFLAIFVVAVAAIFLMLSMTKKLRKVNHRAGVETTASATFGDGTETSGGSVGSGGSGSGGSGSGGADGSGGTHPVADGV
ncbi:hypothetical protein SAMN05216410_2553 [Sanguibacter gelidistatuariae]|uniref:Uncharacterized protein n=1 Tax=Sanguibacter gelidistatuariae TaxID=1814289 RepID=A0A1G6QKA3_9MICO|nr:hypothetical protein [Sanguibacter gelidistatuariae]SDC92137.1 hypothetical protein SAMN05216410_2553 [Sanguibacter gelidistatuariae]